jgi:thermitase
VAPDAHFVVAKAMGDDGSGTTEDINRGIQWVVDHGAQVVNLSLGDPAFEITARLGTPIQPAIEYAWSRGAIPVLASGNYEQGFGAQGSANYGNLDAVVVGSTAKDGTVPAYSTSLGNAKWGIVAPGGNGDGAGADVLSTAPGGRYAWMAGTSLATPHVSGALALLLAQGLTPSAAVQRLLTTADRSVACGTGCQGRLRVDSAVAVAGGTPVAKQATVAPMISTGPAPKDLDFAVVALAIVLVVGAAGATFGTWTWLQGQPGPAARR